MKSLMKYSLAAVLLGGLLSACYVVPAGGNTRVVATNGVGTGASSSATSNTLQARLYPTNDAAQRLGAAQATVVINQNGHGTFNAYIGGEQFSGDATRTVNSRSGRANGAAASGRYVVCNYTMNSPTLGTGSCEMSNGARYSMHVSR